MFLKRKRVKKVSLVGVARLGDETTVAGVRMQDDRLFLTALQTSPCTSMPAVIRAVHAACGRNVPESVLTLDRGQYALVSTEAPNVPREEWADAMRWQLKDQVNYPTDNAIIDVLAVPEATQSRASHASIVLIAPYSEVEQRHLESADEGHDWLGVEVPETALRNVCAMGEVDGKAHALMVFGDPYSMLVITFQGELLLARTIEVSLTSGDDKTQEQRGADVGRAGLELLRTLDTFERIHSQASLAHVSVALPPGSETVLEVLGDLVYRPLKPLQLADFLDLSELNAEGERLASSVTFNELCAIGAALRQHTASRGVAQISMQLPSAQTGPVSWSLDRGAQMVGGAAALALVVTFGMTAWTSHVARQAEAAELALTAAGGPLPPGTAAPKPPIMDELEMLRETESRQRALKESLMRLSGNGAGAYSSYLKALARQAPGSLWITGLVIQGNGDDVEMRGRMVDPRQLPAYLEKLSAEAQFRGRRFAQLEVKSVGQDAAAGAQGVSEFSLKARAEGPREGVAASAAASAAQERSQ